MSDRRTGLGLGYAPRPERIEEVAAAVGLLVLGELLGEQRHDEVLDLVGGVLVGVGVDRGRWWRR